MGTVLQHICSIEKESSQTNSFYVVLGIIITQQIDFVIFAAWNFPYGLKKIKPGNS